MLSLTLRQYEYVVAAAEEGSLTRAAEKLNVSQPSVSMAVAALEQHFGRPLFSRRRGTAVTPTAFGRQVVAQGRGLLRGAAALELLDREETGLSGEISFGCYNSLAPLYAGQLLRRMAKQHPNITLHFREADFDQLEDRLRRGHLDCALTWDVGLGPGITRHKVADVRPHILLATNHPLAAQKQIRLAEIASEPLVLSAQPMNWRYILSLFRERGMEPPVAARVESAETLRSLVANGLGNAILYTKPATNSAQDGQPLSAIEIADDMPPQQISFIHRNSEPLDGVLRAVFEAVCGGD